MGGIGNGRRGRAGWSQGPRHDRRRLLHGPGSPRAGARGLPGGERRAHFRARVERGLEAVLASGVRVRGATVHFADDEYDSGPIILQEAVEVREDDTPDSLAARVQAAERRLVPQAVRLFAEGRLAIEGRRVRLRG